MHPEDAYPEHDRAVREWFAARNWPVIETFSSFDAEVYAWRHRGRYGEFTLYVTREVLDRNEATSLPELLDERDAEGALRDLLPEGRAVLRYDLDRLVVRYFEESDT